VSLLDSYNAQTATITPAAAPDRWGKRTGGTPVTADCRFSLDTRQMPMPDGQMGVTRAVMTVGASVAVAIGDTVALTGDSNSYQVVAVETINVLGGDVAGYRVRLA